MKVISCIAEKGGVGKTTLSAIIAAGLRQKSHRVLLIGLDVQRGAPAHFLPSVPKESSAHQWITTGTLTPLPGHLGVDVLTGGSTLEQELRGQWQDKLHVELRKIADRYDVVVIDVPPVIQHLHRQALIASDIALVITTPDSTESYEGFKKVIGEIDSSTADKRRAPSIVIPVINRLSSGRRTAVEREIVRGIHEGYKDRFNILEVPECAIVAKALAQDHPEHALMRKSPAQGVLGELLEALDSVIREPTPETTHG